MFFILIFMNVAHMKSQMFYLWKFGITNEALVYLIFFYKQFSNSWVSTSTGKVFWCSPKSIHWVFVINMSYNQLTQFQTSSFSSPMKGGNSIYVSLVYRVFGLQTLSDYCFSHWKRNVMIWSMSDTNLAIVWWVPGDYLIIAKGLLKESLNFHESCLLIRNHRDEYCT